MPIYKMSITEILNKRIYVEAADRDKAYELANKLYDDGDIVLDADDYVDTEKDFDEVDKGDLEVIKDNPDLVYRA